MPQKCARIKTLHCFHCLHPGSIAKACYSIYFIRVSAKTIKRIRSIPVDTQRRFNVYTTSATSYRCPIDVETTPCVSWDYTPWTNSH